MDSLTFQQIIKIINNRPMMLVGEKNIYYIFFYLTGYLSAKKCKEFSSDEVDFKNNFQNWVSDKYRSDRNRTWADILLFYEHTHDNAIKSFSTIYDEFKNRNSA